MDAQEWQGKLEESATGGMDPADAYAIADGAIADLASREREIAELRAAILEPGGWEERCKTAEREIEELKEEVRLSGENYVKEVARSEKQSVLIARVVRYGRHEDHCGYVFDHATQTGEMVQDCTCGLDAALKDARRHGHE